MEGSHEVTKREQKRMAAKRARSYNHRGSARIRPAIAHAKTKALRKSAHITRWVEKHLASFTTANSFEPPPYLYDGFLGSEADGLALVGYDDEQEPFLPDLNEDSDWDDDDDYDDNEWLFAREVHLENMMAKFDY